MRFGKRGCLDGLFRPRFAGEIPLVLVCGRLKK